MQSREGDYRSLKRGKDYNGSKDSDKRRSSMKVEASKHGTTEETLFTGI
jgi:hypothetical protein